jgi:hypothetical protein
MPPIWPCFQELHQLVFVESAEWRLKSYHHFNVLSCFE